MAAYTLRLAPAATDDLRQIVQSSLRQWGQAQSEVYLAKLKTQLWLLTTQPLMGVDRSELFPGLRSLPCGMHRLFYRLNAKQVEVIRILHCRQDPYQHL